MENAASRFRGPSGSDSTSRRIRRASSRRAAEREGVREIRAEVRHVRDGVRDAAELALGLGEHALQCVDDAEGPT